MSLKSEFIAGLPSDSRAQFATKSLESLAQLVGQARETWPELDIPGEVFVAYLAQRVTGIHSLDELHIDDLFLACACATGQEDAIGSFERHCNGQSLRATAKLPLSKAQVADLEQQLRCRLFVSETPGGEHIRKYSGMGPLTAWYRTTALRAGIDMVRAESRLRPEAAVDNLNLRAVLIDPELSFLKASYRQQFKTSFQAAFAQLPSEQRNLLRYQLLDGLSLKQIGVLHGVHLSSIGRRLEKSKAALLENTKLQLQEKLGVHADEVDSVMRLIRSRLDVSLSAVLREQA